MKTILLALLVILSSNFLYGQKTDYYFGEAIDFDQSRGLCMSLVPFPASNWNQPILSLGDKSSFIRHGNDSYSIQGSQNDHFLKGDQIEISSKIRVQYFKGIGENCNRLIFYDTHGLLTEVISLTPTPPAQQGAAANP